MSSVLLNLDGQLLDLAPHLVDDVRVVGLYALDIILNLLLKAGLADPHTEDVPEERFELCVVREGAIDTVFVLDELLASLGDHDPVKDYVFFLCGVSTAILVSPKRCGLRLVSH